MMAENAVERESVISIGLSKRSDSKIESAVRDMALILLEAKVKNKVKNVVLAPSIENRMAVLFRPVLVRNNEITAVIANRIIEIIILSLLLKP